MSTRDPRVDAYIAEAAEFARPILLRIREWVHKGCPEATETLKWSAPTFMRKKILCGMAAFKQHCTFGFWVGDDALGIKPEGKFEAWGQFGRLTKIEDLPSEKVFLAALREAVRLDEAGVKRERKHPPKPKPPVEPPDDLLAALKKNKKARETFDNFSPSHKREYTEWLLEAKRPETRAKRLEQTVQWLTEGKSRNWKYQNC